MRPLLRSLLALLATLPTLRAEWEEVELGGKSYVTARSVASFYRFEPVKVEENAVVLSNRQVSCRLPLEGRFADLNGLRVDIEEPVKRHGDRFLVTRLTLVKTLDPLLRPARFGLGRSLRTLVVHPDPDSGDLAPAFARLLADPARWEPLKLEVRPVPEALREAPADRVLGELNPQRDVHFILVRATLADEPGVRSRVLAPVGVAGFGNTLQPAHQRKLAGNAVDSVSLTLAAAVHGSILTGARLPDRGLLRSRDPWLKGCRHPSLILELQLPRGAEKGRRAEPFVEAVSEAVVEGIRRYVDATQPRTGDPD